MNEINSNIILVRIPCSLEGQKDFYLEISRADKTHINCKSKNQWIDFFKKIGFKNVTCNTGTDPFTKQRTYYIKGYK